MGQKPHDVSHVGQDKQAGDGREKGAGGADHGAPLHGGAGVVCELWGGHAHRLACTDTKQPRQMNVKPSKSLRLLQKQLKPNESARTCRWFINSRASVYLQYKRWILAGLPRVLIRKIAHFRKMGLTVSGKWRPDIGMSMKNAVLSLLWQLFRTFW